jgi:hypothetical protein
MTRRRLPDVVGATMAGSKLLQSILIIVLAVLGGLFLLFLILDRSIWLPASLLEPVGPIVFIFVICCFHSVIDPQEMRWTAKLLEYLVMVALVMVVFLVAITALDHMRWYLLPMWVLPAVPMAFLLLSFGLIFGLHREEGKIKFRSTLHKLELCCGLGFLVLGTVLFLFWLHSTRDSSHPLSFDGSSDQLKQTVIVPTLDTPIPEGKSVIWCSSFQIAWNKFKTDVAREPVRIKGAELVADRLNQAEQSEEDLEPDSHYAAVGLVRDGIVEKIQSDMAQRFPQVPKIDFHKSGQEIVVAFGYLQAEVAFRPPFLERDGPIVFRSQEKDYGIEAKFFGIPAKPGHQQLRDQVEILYYAHQEDEDGFAVDLCKSSIPNQVVLASLSKKATLGETLSDLAKKSSSFIAKGTDLRFDDRDSLGVPNMHWRIKHRFSELQGQDKALLNRSLQGQWIGEAIQLIEFKLDRRNASVTSQAMMKTFGQAGPRTFLFNSPFLLYMKKRGAKHPFFVMWVDNAELLIKK